MKVDQALDDICFLAANVMAADVVCLVKCVGRSAGQIIGSYGTNLRGLVGDCHVPGLDARGENMKAFVSARSLRWFNSHPLANIFPYPKNAIVSILDTPPGETSYLVALNSRLALTGKNAIKNALPRLASVVDSLVSPSSLQMDQAFAESSPESGATNSPLGDVILNSLLREVRWVEGRDVSYLALRRWKSTARAQGRQLMMTLRGSDLQALAKVAANDMLESIVALAGRVYFDSIIPVFSRKDQIADQATQLLASRLALAYGSLVMDCFEPVYRNSQSREPAVSDFRIIQKPFGHSLLVAFAHSDPFAMALALRSFRRAEHQGIAAIWIGP